MHKLAAIKKISNSHTQVSFMAIATDGAIDESIGLCTCVILLQKPAKEPS